MEEIQKLCSDCQYGELASNEGPCSHCSNMGNGPIVLWEPVVKYYEDKTCANCIHEGLGLLDQPCIVCSEEKNDSIGFKPKPELVHPRNEEELKGVTLLGNQNTEYKTTYAPEVLESFINKHLDNDYMVTFNAYEFSSLCPKTGQPDFAQVFINYIPNERMVESKSLKLYLFSFRNHGDFHEDCANIIMKDLIKLMDPKYIEVRMIFTPRGGISIYPFANYAQPGSGYEEQAKQRMFQACTENNMVGWK